MSDAMPVDAYIASQYDGEVIEAYFPRADGDCDLLWLFDGVGLPDHEPRKYLRVRLTETEARAAFERPRAQVGVLEPVRSSLRYRDAVVFQDLFKGGDRWGYGDFTVPQDGDETVFLAALDDAEVVTESDLVQRARNRIARLDEMERELDAALSEAGPLEWILRSVSSATLRWQIRRLRRSIERDIQAERSLKETMSSASKAFQHALV